MKAGILIQPLKNGRTREMLVSIPIKTSASGDFCGHVVAIPELTIQRAIGRKSQWDFGKVRPFLVSMNSEALSACSIVELSGEIEMVAGAALELAAVSIPVKRRTVRTPEGSIMEALEPIPSAHDEANELRWCILSVWFAMKIMKGGLRKDRPQWDEFYRLASGYVPAATQERVKKAAQGLGIKFPKSQGKKSSRRFPQK